MNSMRELTVTVAPEGVTPSGPLDAGVQGDHNATEVVFLLDEKLVDGAYRYRLEYEDGMGSCDQTEPITPEEGCVRCFLPLAWTQSGGVGLLRLVVSLPGEDGDEQTVYTGAVRLRYASRALGAGKLAAERPLLATLTEQVKAKADKAVGTAGHVAVLSADGNAADGGVPLAEMATRTLVEEKTVPSFKPYLTVESVVADAANCPKPEMYVLWLGEDGSRLSYGGAQTHILKRGDVLRLAVTTGVLTDCETVGRVSQTQYAVQYDPAAGTESVYGLVTAASPAYVCGIQISGGALGLYAAGAGEIDARHGSAAAFCTPITVSNLDYAVKAALTADDAAYPWTRAEHEAACHRIYAQPLQRIEPMETQDGQNYSGTLTAGRCYLASQAVSVTVTGFEKPVIPAADAEDNGYWELQLTAAEGITVTLPENVVYVGAEPAYTAGHHYVLSFERHHLSGRYLCAWAEV